MSANCRWSREEIEKLIVLVQQNDCLYNVKSTLYMDREVKSQVLNEISHELQQLNSRINVYEIKRKWKNLRTQYMKEVRALQASKKSSHKIVYQPKLWCFQKLSFLETHAKMRERNIKLEDYGSSLTMQNHDSTHDDYTLSMSAEENSINAGPPWKQPKVEENSTEHIYMPMDTNSRVSFTEEVSSSSPLNNRKKNKDSAYKKVALERHEMLKKIVKNITDAKERKYAKLGDFVAMTVESMNNPELEKFADVKIRMFLAEMCQEAAKREIESMDPQTDLDFE